MNRPMKEFTELVWKYYLAHGRDMPWRSRPTPYNVIISEIMLQQTQVSRVMVKFKSFVKKFPNWKSLAGASTKDVLKEWSGLGYNRRALYLKRIAEIMHKDPSFNLSSFDKLHTLPGIGPNTAGSILAFAFNKPWPFIEDRKSTRLNSSHVSESRMPSSA